MVAKAYLFLAVCQTLHINYVESWINTDIKFIIVYISRRRLKSTSGVIYEYAKDVEKSNADYELAKPVVIPTSHVESGDATTSHGNGNVDHPGHRDSTESHINPDHMAYEAENRRGAELAENETYSYIDSSHIRSEKTDVGRNLDGTFTTVHNDSYNYIDPLKASPEIAPNSEDVYNHLHELPKSEGPQSNNVYSHLRVGRNTTRTDNDDYDHVVHDTLGSTNEDTNVFDNYDHITHNTQGVGSQNTGHVRQANSTDADYDHLGSLKGGVGKATASDDYDYVSTAKNQKKQFEQNSDYVKPIKNVNHERGSGDKSRDYNNADAQIDTFAQEQPSASDYERASNIPGKYPDYELAGVANI